MDVPRPELASELQLPAYTAATATWGLSRVHSPHHSSRQCWIPYPLSKTRDQFIKKDKEGCYLMINGSILEEDITLINTYASDIEATKIHTILT